MLFAIFLHAFSLRMGDHLRCHLLLCVSFVRLVRLSAACSGVQVVGRSVVQGTGRKAAVLGRYLARCVCYSISIVIVCIWPQLAHWKGNESRFFAVGAAVCLSGSFRGFRTPTSTFRASAILLYIFSDTFLLICEKKPVYEIPILCATSARVIFCRAAAALIGAICSLFFDIFIFIFAAKVRISDLFRKFFYIVNICISITYNFIFILFSKSIAD